MHKVLVVEDEELIRTMIKLNFERAGYGVRCSVDAENMLETIAAETFDLILLDIMLPGMSGERALKTLRSRGIGTPVIMVTARNNVGTKLDSFAFGADDYVSKPFDMKELLARANAIIRRFQGNRVIPSGQLIAIGSARIDLDRRVADTPDGEYALSEKEVDLLAYFNDHVGETLDRSDILEYVWGMDADPTPRTVDNYIVKFRKLFEEDAENPKHFLTVYSKGYRFVI